MPEFTAAEVATIQRCWGVVKCADIGRRLGRSKSSIVGKAHRLNLPKLDTPVGKRGNAAHRRPKHDAPGARPVPPPRSIVQPASSARLPASLPSAAAEYGPPGVWRAPVALDWAQIQTIAADAFFLLTTRDRLPALNRLRVGVGLAPLAIAMPGKKGNTDEIRISPRSIGLADPGRAGGL